MFLGAFFTFRNTINDNIELTIRALYLWSVRGTWLGWGNRRAGQSSLSITELVGGFKGRRI